VLDLQSSAAQERNPIVSLYRDYSASWLRNDASTESLVLGLFDTNAVIVPSGGQMIFQGQQALRNFWFPPDAPPSTVDLFDQEILSVSMDESSGFLLGSFKMSFTDPSGSYYTEGFHTVYAAKVSSDWKITTMMWSHPPWELMDRE